MVLCALAVGWLTQSPISFETRGATAAAVVAHLGEKTGRDLQVVGPIRNEVLIVRVKDASSEELLAKIAAVLRAEWQTTDHGLRLVRPPELARALELQEQDDQVRRVEELMKAHARRIKSSPSAAGRATAFFKAVDLLHQQEENPSGGMSLDGPRKASPGSTLVHELALAIGTKEIAAIPPDVRVVYSNRPNARQRPFPAKAAEALRSFAEAQAQIAQMIPQEVELKPWLKNPIFADIVEGASETVDKVRFSATNRYGFMSYDVFAYSPSGHQITWGFTHTWDLLGYDRNPPSLVTRPLGRLALSKESAVFGAFSSPNPDIGPAPPAPRKGQALPPEYRKLFENPEKRDPLSFAVADAVLGLASKLDRDLVACVPDGLIRAVRESTKDEKIDLDMLWAILRGPGGTRWTKEPGWLLLQPARPILSEALRLSRPALGNYLRACFELGKMSLEPFSRYHFEAGKAAKSNTLVRTYDSLLIGAGVQDLQGRQSVPHEFFAFVGSLSPSQWRGLERGGALELARLAGPQRELGQSWLDVAWIERDEGVSESQVPDLVLAADELFPEGGVGSAVLTSTSRTEIVLSYRLAGLNASESRMSLDRLAGVFASYFRDRPIRLDEGPLGDEPLRLGTRASAVFTLRLAPGVVSRAEVALDAFDPAVEPRKLSELPADVRSQLKSRAEAIQRGGSPRAAP